MTTSSSAVVDHRVPDVGGDVERVAGAELDLAVVDAAGARDRRHVGELLRLVRDAAQLALPGLNTE